MHLREKQSRLRDRGQQVSRCLKSKAVCWYKAISTPHLPVRVPFPPVLLHLKGPLAAEQFLVC